MLIAAPRLARCGIPVPRSAASAGLPEHDLYDLLVAQHGLEAYRYYRSLLQQLVSLENALDNAGAASARLHEAHPAVTLAPQ
jgi:hypothetical protein